MVLKHSARLSDAAKHTACTYCCGSLNNLVALAGLAFISHRSHSQEPDDQDPCAQYSGFAIFPAPFQPNPRP